jgi:hypothetical protein
LHPSLPRSESAQASELASELASEPESVVTQGAK